MFFCFSKREMETATLKGWSCACNQIKCRM